jgi:ligand-binding sensor domain-containing protein
MKKIGHFISFIFIIILTGCEKEQGYYPQWLFYDMLNSGIPDNEVTGIAFDGLGNKWIGTNSGGIAKFDGISWTVYNTSNSGLPDDHIVCLGADKQDHIWIGTNGNGLVQFDGKNFNHYTSDNSKLSNDVINCLAVDKEGSKWVGTQYGLVKIKDTSWTIYYPKGILVSVNFLSVDGQGNVWIASHDPVIAKLAVDKWIYYYYYETIPDAYTNCFSADLQGNAWVGVKSNSAAAGYLLKLNDTEWTVYDYSNSGIYVTGVNCLGYDEQGHLWLGSSKITSEATILRFDGVNWQSIVTSVFPINSFSPVFISEDILGNKWICTHTGLFVFNENGIK